MVHVSSLWTVAITLVWKQCKCSICCVILYPIKFQMSLGVLSIMLLLTLPILPVFLKMIIGIEASFSKICLLDFSYHRILIFFIFV